jgi:hypothetical protein
MGYARFVGTEFRAAAARPLRRGSVYDEPLQIPAAGRETADNLHEFLA